MFALSLLTPLLLKLLRKQINNNPNLDNPSHLIVKLPWFTLMSLEPNAPMVLMTTSIVPPVFLMKVIAVEIRCHMANTQLHWV